MKPQLAGEVSRSRTQSQALNASKSAPGSAMAAPLQANATGRSRSRKRDKGNAKSGSVANKVFATDTSSRLTAKSDSQKPPEGHDGDGHQEAAWEAGPPARFQGSGDLPFGQSDGQHTGKACGHAQECRLQSRDLAKAKLGDDHGAAHAKNRQETEDDSTRKLLSRLPP